MSEENLYDEFGNFIEVDEDEGELTDREKLVTLDHLMPLMFSPSLVRNVALVGHWKHGKSLFKLMLAKNRVDQMHLRECSGRHQSKTKPISLVLEVSDSESYLCNIMDTPGRLEFSDEMSAALRLADGAVLVVDVADGVRVGTDGKVLMVDDVRVNTERAIRHAIEERLPIVLVINQVDRLITELQVPPKDAYDIISRLIGLVNSHITTAASHFQEINGGNVSDVQVMDPVYGNVCFASARDGWCVTLQSFATLYSQRDGIPFNASWLWGEYYFDHNSRTINERQQSTGPAERCFVQLVLEPLYKMYNQFFGQNKEIGDATLDPSLILGSLSGLIDMLVHHIPSAKVAAAKKVEHIYTGPKDSKLYRMMERCDPYGCLMANLTKLYPKFQSRVIHAYGRVYSGSIYPGQTVRVGNDGLEDEDIEDIPTAKVRKLWVPYKDYMVSVSAAPAGSCVLIKGVDKYIYRTATITCKSYDGVQDLYLFRPLQFNTLPVMKLAIEPRDPSQLEMMRSGLIFVSKSYPLAEIIIEDSGLHTISGTGKLYLEYIKRDLFRYGVKLESYSYYATFRETVVESSSRCYAENEINMIVEPLKKGIAEDIESGVVNANWPRRVIKDFFNAKFKYDLDSLDAESIWGFGPDEQGPNILLNASEDLLNVVKDPIVDGFYCATHRGPLCNEPVRNVKFKIVDVKVGGEIPMSVRFDREARSSLIKATPRLMEPVYYVEIETEKCSPEILKVISRRRGHVIPEPAGIVKAFVPVAESTSLEVALSRYDLPCAMVFDHWAIVPGDPLQPADPPRELKKVPRVSRKHPKNLLEHDHLAHEFMVRTRLLKGMNKDIQ